MGPGEQVTHISLRQRMQSRTSSRRLAGITQGSRPPTTWLNTTRATSASVVAWGEDSILYSLRGEEGRGGGGLGSGSVFAHISHRLRQLAVGHSLLAWHEQSKPPAWPSLAPVRQHHVPLPWPHQPAAAHCEAP